MSTSVSIENKNQLIEPLWIEDAKKPQKSYKWLYISLAVVFVAMVVAGVIVGNHIHKIKLMEESLASMQRSLDISFNEIGHTTLGSRTYEYGSEPIKVSDLIASHTGDLEIEGPDVINTMEVGNTEITYHLSMEDEYGQIATKDYVRNYIVEDTTSPVIAISQGSFTIKENDNFDMNRGVASVSDVVDGALPYSATKENGTYTFESNLDVNSPGSYTVNVVATDVNGNQAVASYGVTVEQRWRGGTLNPSVGVVQGPSGRETYYNLPMGGVISIMRAAGYSEAEYPYWVRSDGCKMLGNYIMVAASFDIRPLGTLVETSLGTGIVADTGTFAINNPYQLDLAVNW